MGFPILMLVGAVAFLGACAGGPVDRRSAVDMQAVQVTAPGRAACMATSRDQLVTGVAATNVLRGRAGLAPVRANMLLAEVAAGHACDMARRGRMTHAGSTTTGPGPRVKAAGYAPQLTAENIAAGPFDLSRVLSEWHRSPGHLDNVMVPQIRDYGIGQAVGADGRTRFWAAIYAAPRN